MSDQQQEPCGKEHSMNHVEGFRWSVHCCFGKPKLQKKRVGKTQENRAKDC